MTEIAKFNPEETKLYEESINAYRDIVNAINTAKKDGYAEGREEGLAEGREAGIKEAQLRMANTLLQMGMSPISIAQATGLSITDIENLH